MHGKWQTNEQLVKLLSILVEQASITGSPGEIALGDTIYHLLKEQDYFKKHPEYLNHHPLKDGRSIVTGLVRQGDNEETIVLLSHFDVVDVTDYGDLAHLAFRPEQLTKELKSIRSKLPLSSREDLESDEWLFGRGTMDMKAGLSVQLSLLERAMSGEYRGNLLLVTVPDEEVDSAGMLHAVPILNDMKKRYRLTFKACINSEPMFAKYPNDQHHYIYSGSIGKVLAGLYCCGIETHVGEPFSGLNANLLLSELNQLIELNESFCEQVDDEVTPPPTSLMMRDLKRKYSVQIPHASVSMYNLFMMNRQFSDLHEQLIQLAKNAALNVEEFYVDRVSRFNLFVQFTAPEWKVSVFSYSELLQKAINKYGEKEITRRLNDLTANRGDEGDQDYSTRLVAELVGMCKEYAPMIVVFYSPPFYPAVSSKENKQIQRTVEHLITYMKKEYEITMKQQNYFPGLCDLSFLQLNDNVQSVSQLTTNMPLYGKHFNLPLKEMHSLNIPVLNIGPLGRDPHKWTERLHIPYSFTILPELLHLSIYMIFEQNE